MYDIINPQSHLIVGTFFSSLYSSQGELVEIPLLDLIGRQVKVLTDKRSASLFSLSTFVNNVRDTANALLTSALVFDFDHKNRQQVLGVAVFLLQFLATLRVAPSRCLRLAAQSMAAPNHAFSLV